MPVDRVPTLSSASKHGKYRALVKSRRPRFRDSSVGLVDPGTKKLPRVVVLLNKLTAPAGWVAALL